MLDASFVLDCDVLLLMTLLLVLLEFEVPLLVDGVDEEDGCLVIDEALELDLS